MSSRRVYHFLVSAAATALVALLVVDAWLAGQHSKYQTETRRLRASMSTLERSRADELIDQERNKTRLAIALLRHQARVEPQLHLSITIDSAAMYLESEGALLREMPIHIGPERRVGIPPDTVRLAIPRGARTIARVFTENDVWDVPEWVYADRGIPIPQDRLVRGALGPAAVLLDGGTVIYSMPTEGPLADSGYVMPGAVRTRGDDLRAILPNLKPGLRAYFY
jgi:hypothetical protein